MAYCRQIALPDQEPVSLAEMKSRLRLDAGPSADDRLITSLIRAAREIAETYTGRSLAQRAFTEALDAFPYWTDTIQIQAAYPPSFYSLPRFSTTLWNYSQVIKLSNGPVVSVQALRYVASDGSIQTLVQDQDYILDRVSEPARIFPLAGGYWPPCLNVPNAVQIDYTAGFDSDPGAADTHTVAGSPPNQQTPSTIVTGIPESIRDGIMAIVHFRYDNPGQAIEPQYLYNLFGGNVSIDFAPTRG